MIRIELDGTKVDFVPDQVYTVNLDGKIRFGNLCGGVVNEIFKDGRISGLISEYFICDLFKSLKRSDSEKAPYDVYCTKWMHGYECRTVTKGGVNFCPSYMLGKGREYNETEHHEKINNVHGFIFFDIVNMPEIKITVVSRNHPNHGTLYKRHQSYKSFMKTFYTP